MDPNWTSIIPPFLAVVLAFITRDAVISLAVACLSGILLMGQGIQGFPKLITRALGNENFIWLVTMEFCIGILVAFFQRSGAVRMFTKRAEKWVDNRKQVSSLGWGLGMCIFFSDYFSPLFVGPVMRDLTDKYRVSREKLAYICDSTSAPLIVIIPITSFAAYISSFTIGTAGIETREQALSIFIKSIPLNFYAYLSVIMVLFIALRLIPEFGPMKKAEDRAVKTGKVMRDGSVPMMGKELTDLEVSESGNTNILLNFILPVMIIITTNISSFMLTGTAAVLESYVLSVTVLGIILWLQKVDNLQGIMFSVFSGMKGVMPAVVILALAYGINTVSQEMKTAEYIVETARDWLSPNLLPLLIFIISGLISFATGTSWGTYAIMVPIAMQLAYQFSGQVVDVTVYSSLAAVAGGGIFGDHCSPLSDTTVLSSLGSACDHIDHVKTQLPYALTVAGIASVFYLIIGYM